MGKGKNARRLKIKKNLLIEKSADFDCGKIVARIDEMSAAIMMLTEAVEKLTVSNPADTPVNVIKRPEDKHKSIPIDFDDDMPEVGYKSIPATESLHIPLKVVGKIQPFDITKEEFDDTPSEIKDFLKQIEEERKNLIEITEAITIPHKVQDVETIGGFEVDKIIKVAIDNNLNLTHVDTIVTGKSEEFLKNRKISNDVKAIHISTTIALFSALGLKCTAGAKKFGYKNGKYIYNWQYRLKGYMPN